MSYAKGPMAVDWEDRYDLVALREKRVDRVRAELATSDLDAVLLWKNENVRYLTSLRAQLIAYKASSLNGVLLSSTASRCSCVPAERSTRLASGCRGWRPSHAMPIMEQRGARRRIRDATSCAPQLRELGIKAGRLGIDQANLSLIESIRQHLPDIELVDGDTSCSERG